MFLYAFALQVFSVADVVERVIDGVVNVRTRDLAVSAGISNDPVARKLYSADRFFELFLFPGAGVDAKAPRSSGSGFYYGSNEFVVTNYHVVKDAESVEIMIHNHRFGIPASIVGFDEKNDIALLKVQPRSDAVPLKFANSEKARIGEAVIAIGNPFGFGHTVTTGILSAKGRTIGTGPFDDFLQTDAAINPGNSGGPLFNVKGEVLGINTAILPDARGISFAIPAEIAKPLIDSFMQQKKWARAYLGVIGGALTEESEKSKDNFGIYVRNLAKNSPAEKSGIKQGDVILSFDGKIIRDLNDIAKLVRKVKPGQNVTLQVYREGKPLKISMTAVQIPDDENLRKIQDLL